LKKNQDYPIDARRIIRQFGTIRNNSEQFGTHETLNPAPTRSFRENLPFFSAWYHMKTMPWSSRTYQELVQLGSFVNDNILPRMHLPAGHFSCRWNWCIGVGNLLAHSITAEFPGMK
jgi:hypothetical protein